MAYNPTNWIDDVTPVSAQNLNKIEQGITDLEADKIPLTQKAAADGVATLDTGGDVPADQLGNTIDAIEDSSIVWELIARRAFTVDASTFFFTGIPTEYTALKLVAKARSGDYSDSTLGVKINGVTDGYAYKTTLNGVTTSASSQTKINFTDAIRSFNATGDRTCTIEMVFSSLPTGLQDFYGFSNNINQGQLSIIGEWISGQITSMEISSTDGFDAGSVVLLFGCKNLWV